MSEKCGRCGSVGEDRRTLLMDCFYDMGELGIPFARPLIFHASEGAEFEMVTGPTCITTEDGRSIALGSGEVRCYGTLLPAKVFALRTCKRCRGEWMVAIKAWFEAEPRGIDHDADERPVSPCGSGIFIRENGSIREISEEEWAARNPDREPVRYRP